jgi:hypothetical protein
MIRRRRPTREIAFSFDSFLDLVANVVGIIIRLILVVWVGARSYTSLPPGFSLVSDDTPAIVEDLPPEEPLKFDLAKDREELDKAQAQLIAELRQLRSAEDIKENIQKEFRSLDDKKQTLAAETQKLDNVKKTSQHLAVSAALSLEEIKKRYTKLSEEIIAVRKLPPAKKALTYRTPISRPVQAEEIIFECQNGRVAFIDIDLKTKSRSFAISGKSRIQPRPSEHFDCITPLSGRGALSRAYHATAHLMRMRTFVMV